MARLAGMLACPNDNSDIFKMYNLKMNRNLLLRVAEKVAHGDVAKVVGSMTMEQILTAPLMIEDPLLSQEVKDVMSERKNHLTNCVLDGFLLSDKNRMSIQAEQVLQFHTGACGQESFTGQPLRVNGGELVPERIHPGQLPPVWELQASCTIFSTKGSAVNTKSDGPTVAPTLFHLLTRALTKRFPVISNEKLASPFLVHSGPFCTDRIERAKRKRKERKDKREQEKRKRQRKRLKEAQQKRRDEKEKKENPTKAEMKGSGAISELLHEAHRRFEHNSRQR